MIASAHGSLRSWPLARFREPSVAIQVPGALWIATAASPPRDDVAGLAFIGKGKCCVGENPAITPRRPNHIAVCETLGEQASVSARNQSSVLRTVIQRCRPPSTPRIISRATWVPTERAADCTAERTMSWPVDIRPRLVAPLFQARPSAAPSPLRNPPPWL